jgi:putative PIN family toxin of toxin-antitoxin system
VVDTNAHISGVFFGGSPSRIVDSCLAGDLLMVVSPDVLREYRRVDYEFAGRKAAVDFDRFLNLLIAAAVVVDPAPLPAPVCRDAADDKFIACALAGNAGIIVSGDKDLLAVGLHADVRVLRPARFVAEYLG